MSGASEYVMFCDESGQSQGPPYYTIGALTMPRGLVPALEARIREQRELYGVSERFGELKWKKVKDEQGLRYVNFMNDLFFRVLCHPAMRLHFIVVRKSVYNKWKRRSDHEEAFYITYNHLISHASRYIPGAYEVIIDRRSDSYRLWPEAMERIANRMLNQRNGAGSIGHVQMVNSKTHPGVQLVDLFTGAINAAHILSLEPTSQMQAAKKVAMRCMARILDWDHLAYDTFPLQKDSSEANEIYNVWHFPRETRGPSMDAPELATLRTPVALTHVQFANALDHPSVQNPYTLRRHPQASAPTSAITTPCKQPLAIGSAHSAGNLAATG